MLTTASMTASATSAILSGPRAAAASRAAAAPSAAAATIARAGRRAEFTRWMKVPAMGVEAPKRNESQNSARAPSSTL